MNQPAKGELTVDGDDKDGMKEVENGRRGEDEIARAE